MVNLKEVQSSSGKKEMGSILPKLWKGFTNAFQFSLHNFSNGLSVVSKVGWTAFFYGLTVGFPIRRAFGLEMSQYIFEEYHRLQTEAAVAAAEAAAAAAVTPAATGISSLFSRS
jgi:hypothetical protein